MLTLSELKKICEDAQVLDYCLPILDDPKFLNCPLNLESSKPYSYVGGLIHYTNEIISSGILICSLYKNYNSYAINIREFVLSAIWHNYGKLVNYECNSEDLTCWTYDQQSSKIETAYTSAKHFERFVESLPNSSETQKTLEVSFTNVTHNILSTLTLTPLTIEAHILNSVIKLSEELYAINK